MTDTEGSGRTRALLRAVVARAEGDRERGQASLRRGIFLLPNLITTGALFAGFYAMVAAMKGDFIPAAIATYAAMVLDTLDGRVARSPARRARSAPSTTASRTWWRSASRRRSWRSAGRSLSSARSAGW